MYDPWHTLQVWQADETADRGGGAESRLQPGARPPENGGERDIRGAHPSFALSLQIHGELPRGGGGAYCPVVHGRGPAFGARKPFMTPPPPIPPLPNHRFHSYNANLAGAFHRLFPWSSSLGRGIGGGGGLAKRQAFWTARSDAPNLHAVMFPKI
jgi:hypothetical protein